MKKNILSIVISVTLLGSGIGMALAEQSSPMAPVNKSQNQTNEGSIVGSAELAVKIVDQFPFNYALIRQGDGSYLGTVLGSVAYPWAVTGRLSTTSFEFHAVNPFLNEFCGSYIWEGTRTGNNLSGRAFNEPTQVNRNLMCTFDATVTGTLTVVIQ